MNKNRLTILLVVFSFLVLIIVLSSTVFSVKNITISFASTPTILASKDEQIIQSAKFVKGQNIFLVSKKYHISNMQAEFPFLKVINIESKFPSSIIIHAQERKNLVTIKDSNNNYALCDSELFCTSSSQVYDNNDTSPILIYKQEASILEKTEIGSEANIDSSIKNYLKRVLYFLFEYKSTPQELFEKIREIVVDYEESGQILIKMRQGLNIVINDVVEFTSGKLNYAFSYFEAPTSTINQGTLYVNHDNEDYIHGYYRQ